MVTSGLKATIFKKVGAMNLLRHLRLRRSGIFRLKRIRLRLRTLGFAIPQEKIGAMRFELMTFCTPSPDSPGGRDATRWIIKQEPLFGS